MKTLILYYSYTGNCKKEAETIASDYSKAVLYEVKEMKKRTKFNAFMSGCPKAMARKTVKIHPITCDLNEFDKIVIVCPIWSGYPVPAFNAMVELLPQRKEIELFFCSGGGETPKSKEGTIALITSKNCKLVAYHDIKTYIPKK